MKARFNISLTLAAACLCGLSSCVSIVSGDGTGDTAISFATPSADTKAAVEGGALTEGSFLVWGGYGEDASSVNATNVFNGDTVIGLGGAWNYTGGTRYWVAGKTYDFYAVYPAGIFSGQSGAPTVYCSKNGTLTINNFDASATGEAAVDLMTASATSVDADNMINAGDAVKLSFKHELARVKFTVVSEGDALTISDAKLYGISHTGSLKKEDWTLPKDTNTAENTPFKTDEPIIIDDTKDHLLFGGDLLLPPQTLSDGAILAFSYQYEGEGDTDSHSVTLYVKTTNVAKWTAGQRYNYRISIPQNSVDVTLDVTVKDWVEQDFTVTW